MRTLGIVLTIAIASGLLVHGFPGKLSEQRHEFQQRSVPAESEELSSIATTPEYEDFEPVTFKPSPKWSQQHQNEVNAFAEVYRQNYNQLVDQYNRMFGLQYGYVMPVQYQLFQLPTGISWQDFFGNQQQYVSQQTEEMSRRLFYQIQNGTIAQHELEAPSFFLNQAADLLDHVHGHVQEAVPPQQQYESGHEDTDTQQQFKESDHEKVLAFNPATGIYEYVYIQKTLNEDKSSARENVRTSYIQKLPPVQFDNRAARRDIENSEELFERTTIPSTTQKTTTDNYYGSTYEQQQVYDLQFLESISSSSTPKPNNVMSLVRKKQGPSRTLTTTTTTTTPKPTTESNVMSMLPHKQQKLDYINLHQQIRQALDQHMKQQNNATEHEETHFMGMNSNQDHLKLTYDVVDGQQSKPNQEAARGDKPSSDEDFVTDETVELSVTESTPSLVTQKVTVKPSSPRPKSTQRTRMEPATARTFPLYSAPLAPFPVVIQENKPFYTAPLAPFPVVIHVEPAQSQPNQYSELEDMNQQHFHQEQHAVFPESYDQHQEAQVFEQIPAEFVLPANDQHHAMTHLLDLQQQSSIGPNFNPQFFEKQLPPEQAYRNPEFGIPSAVVPIKRNEEPVPIQDVITTVPVVQDPTHKPWLQRQWTKLVKHF